MLKIMLTVTILGIMFWWAVLIAVHEHGKAKAAAIADTVTVRDTIWMRSERRCEPDCYTGESVCETFEFPMNNRKD